MSKLETNVIDTLSGTSNLTIGSTNSSTVTFENGSPTGHMYPAFETYLSGNQEMSDGANTKIQFNTERFDTDSCYDATTNYRFTPTVAGKYFVYCTVRYDGRANSNLSVAKLNFYKNGSIYTESQNYFITNYIRQICSTRNAIIDMNGSTDYLEMFAYFDILSTGSGNPRITGGSDKESAFGAYRIGS